MSFNFLLTSFVDYEEKKILNVFRKYLFESFGKKYSLSTKCKMKNMDRFFDAVITMDISDNLTAHFEFNFYFSKHHTIEQIHKKFFPIHFHGYIYIICVDVDDVDVYEDIGSYKYIKKNDNFINLNCLSFRNFILSDYTKKKDSPNLIILFNTMQYLIKTFYNVSFDQILFKKNERILLNKIPNFKVDKIILDINDNDDNRDDNSNDHIKKKHEDENFEDIKDGNNKKNGLPDYQPKYIEVKSIMKSNNLNIKNDILWLINEATKKRFIPKNID